MKITLMVKKNTQNKYSASINQEGVTLLLAILILASVLAISFSLTTILFVEIRSSNDLIKTEGALYGATGVGEEAFFNLARQVPNPGYITAFNNNVTLTGPPTVSSASNPVFTDRVLTGTDFNSTTKKYDFCSVEATTSSCSFGKATLNYIVTNSNTDKLYAYLCEWDPNAIYPSEPCTVEGASQGYWIPPILGSYDSTFGSSQLDPITFPSVSWNLDQTKQQELIITNPSGSSTIYYSLSTFAPDGTTPKGLPYVGRTAIIVNTQNGTVGRKIQVSVPTLSSLGSNDSNVALGKTASQSSTLDGSTLAGNAVDGNTDGNYFNGSITHTGFDTNAWWEVDLGASKTLSSISFWNRTDCCSNRLSDFWVFVSDAPFNPSDTPAILSVRAGTWNNHQTSMPNPSTTLTLSSIAGRYVRVQLSGQDYLSLAELQIMGH